MTIALNNMSFTDSPRSVTCMAWKAGVSAKKIIKDPTGSNCSTTAPGISLLAARKSAAESRRAQMLQARKQYNYENAFQQQQQQQQQQQYEFHFNRRRLSCSQRNEESVVDSMMCDVVLPVITTLKKAEKKSVSFSSMATVHTRPTPSSEDLMNAWYNDSEYASFEQDRQNTIRTLHTVHNGNVSELEQDEQYSATGLEKTLTRRLALQRRYQTMQHSFAVLQQQHMNNQNGLYYDDVSIQIASEQYSKTSAAELAAQECEKFRLEHQNTHQHYHPHRNHEHTRHHHHHQLHHRHHHRGLSSVQGLSSVLDEAISLSLSSK